MATQPTFSTVSDQYTLSHQQAATAIQKHWRGYSVRKALKMSGEAAALVIQKAWGAFVDNHSCFVCLGLGDKKDRVKLDCCRQFAHLTKCLHPWFTNIRSAHCPHCRQHTGLELPVGVVARGPEEPIHLEMDASPIEHVMEGVEQGIRSLWHWRGILLPAMAVIQNLRPFADVVLKPHIFHIYAVLNCKSVQLIGSVTSAVFNSSVQACSANLDSCMSANELHFEAVCLNHMEEQNRYADALIDFINPIIHSDWGITFMKNITGLILFALGTAYALKDSYRNAFNLAMAMGLIAFFLI